MRRRIKSSLSLKVFIWVFSALAFCSMLIYGIVLAVLPRQYQAVSDKTLDANMEILVSRLEEMPYGEAGGVIYDFCIQNHVAAVLGDGQGALSFGEIGGGRELTAQTSSIATTVTFSDREAEYGLVVSFVSQTADAILILMLRFLPVVLGIIFLLSFLSAFICSRAIVAPIARLSRISERMLSLDVSWKCEVERCDEIGVLASSLNTMADRLRGAMEELRSFFAAVSHELKTPLTILKGQLENMILGYGDYRNHEKYLPEALKAAENMEHLVREIIAISKMECMDIRDSLEEVSLKQTAEEAVRAVLPLAREKEIRIHQDIRKDQVLSVNPNLWSKALSNVIGNAVRHSPCGGDVFISTESCGNGRALVIENTGVSIPEEDLAHMFTPFYRTDRSRSKATGGSGLGLYVVRTILDLHGMACHMENTGRGVAFFFYILNE